jgi:hypothetical protein
MAAYRPASEEWPRCRVCLMPFEEFYNRQTNRLDRRRQPAPRVEPISDSTLIVHKRPGQPRTKRQLARDGCIVLKPQGGNKQ